MKTIQLVVVLAVLFFTSCGSKISEEEQHAYITRGNEISKKTFKALSSELMGQMKSGGPVQAVSFCTVNALPLTETVSKQNGVQIRRTSDKIRNRENRANARELEVIIAYQAQIDQGKDLQPVIQKNGNQVHYYAPIKVQGACLNCHGTEEQVSKEVDSIIQLKYPNDVAVNYAEGDLRGIWSITFDSEN